MTAGNEKKYFAAADLLRVFAIGFIAWYHIWQQSWLDPGFHIFVYYVNLQQVVRHGYILVDVMLVISGFLLAMPYARAHFGLQEPPSAKEFYRKRFWRIYPSYALAVLLCLFLWALPEGRYDSVSFLFKDVLSHLTFTHNLFFDTYFHTPLQIVLWTMGVEVQFYLLFPVIALFFTEMPRLTCAALSAAALVYRTWTYLQPQTLFTVNQLPSMLDLYACGMLAAYLYIRCSQSGYRPHPVLTASALVIPLLLLVQFMYLQPFGDYEQMRHDQLLFRLPIGLAAGIFLFFGGFLSSRASAVVGNPVIRFLSAVSFNFYMWHQHIAVRLKQAHIPPYTSEAPNMSGEQPWQQLYTAACFLIALAAAALLTYAFEKPIMRMGLKNRTQKQRSLPPSRS